MKEKDKYPHGFCREHGQQYAPMAIAYLIKRESRWKMNETMDKINTNHLTEYEIQDMDTGTMAFRHMVYDGYCQYLPISYDNL